VTKIRDNLRQDL
jgi:chromosome segregation ATPase